MSKAKVKDWRQGRVLFVVRGFPYRENVEPSIEVIYPTQVPRMSRYCSGSLFGKQFTIADDGSERHSEVSLQDRGILPNTYNFHKTFTKRKAAERYAAYLVSGNLSGEDQRKCFVMAQRDLDNDEFDRWMSTFDGHEYDYDESEFA